MDLYRNPRKVSISGLVRDVMFVRKHVPTTENGVAGVVSVIMLNQIKLELLIWLSSDCSQAPAVRSGLTP